jgi:hypothetical protein
MVMMVVVVMVAVMITLMITLMMACMIAGAKAAVMAAVMVPAAEAAAMKAVSLGARQCQPGAKPGSGILLAYLTVIDIHAQADREGQSRYGVFHSKWCH